MFRTRDFILLFTVVVFLISAIGATVWTKRDKTYYDFDSQAMFADSKETEYSAVVDDSNTLSREDKLIQMRAKIADGQGVAISAPKEIPVLEDVVDGEDELLPELDGLSKEYPDLCLDYKIFSGLWGSKGLMFEEVEGSRLIFKEVEKEVIDMIGTSTFATSTTIVKETVLQLPVRYAASSNTSCIDSDVVGVALDGSLIRNNESALYGVFGEDTLVGYSLDGLPIYGTTNRELDVCGGTSSLGNYRYYLSKDREVVLNCFSAAPIKM